MRLLLRAADPRLSRPVAGAGFRIEAARQAGCACAPGKRAGGAGLRTADDCDRHQHRSLSADRARAEDHARHPRSAGARRPPGRHRDKVGAGDPRHRYSGQDGRAQSGQGRAVGDHARRQTRAHHGAARLDAAETAGGAAATLGSRHSGHRDGRAGDSSAERFARSSAFSMRQAMRGPRRRATCCCGCRWKFAISSANG